MTTMQVQMALLPTYMVKDLANIPQRKPNSYDYGGNEQADFFTTTTTQTQGATV